MANPFAIVGKLAGAEGRVAGKGLGKLAGTSVKAGASVGIGGMLLNSAKGALSGLGSKQGSISSSGSSKPYSVTPLSGVANDNGLSGFVPPAANDNFRRSLSNGNASDVNREILKTLIEQSNTLSGIQSVLKTGLKFETAKANYQAKALAEKSIEGGNRTSGSITAASSPGSGAAGGLAGIAALAAIPAILAIAARLLDKPSAASDSATPPGTAQTGWRGMVQGAGDTAYAASMGGDARRHAGRVSNVSRAIPRTAGSALSRVEAVSSGIVRSASKAPKLLKFLKIIKSLPLARIPGLNVALAAIDPLIAYYESGGETTSEVKKQFVGSIAMLLGGSGGVAVGAALGSIFPGPGTIVGGILGGVIGSLGAEFVAEQLFEVLIGNMTINQLRDNLVRGTVSGFKRLPMIAAGAAIGTVGLAGRAITGAAAIAPTVRGASAITSRAAPIAIGGAIAATTIGAVAISSAPSGSQIISDAAQYSGSDLITEARKKAEAYLGRPMHETEWTTLIKAVYAESGGGAGGREDAMIMGTILNRARSGGRKFRMNHTSVKHYLDQGLTVLAALYAPSQFEAVTGGGRTGNRGSVNFRAGPGSTRLDTMLRGVLEFLFKVPRTQVSFGSANPKAYTSHAAFIRHMNRNGLHSTVGGSVFQSGLGGEGSYASTGPSPTVRGAVVTPGGSSAGGGNLLGRFASALGSLAGAGKPPESMTTDPNISSTAGLEGVGAGTWVMPASGTVSSVMGNRSINGRRGHHNGVDIAAPAGSPIMAAQGGEVIKNAFQARGGGNYISIRHPNGYVTKYMHMQYRSTLKEGDTVSAGQRIGSVGSTGHSTGNHLHFEVRNARGQAVQPRTLLPQLALEARVSSGASQQNRTRAQPTGAQPSVSWRGRPGTTAEASSRGANMSAQSAALESTSQRPVVIQTSSNGSTSGQPIVTQTKTGTGNPTPVNSPVMAQYGYSSYWST